MNALASSGLAAEGVVKTPPAPSRGRPYRAVLAVIGIYAGPDGTAWPSQETIAGIIGIHRATVCRAIKRLRERGYLDRYRKPTSRGRYRNVYQLRYPSYVPPRAEIATTEM